eukprot:5858982-Ditylum_brightwellii.AAC.1
MAKSPMVSRSLALPLEADLMPILFSTKRHPNYKLTPKTVFSILPDIQMATQLSYSCLLECIPFHMVANVLHSFDQRLYNGQHSWSSDLTTAVSTTTKQVLQTAAQQESLPNYAYSIATLPPSENDL